MRMWVIGCWCGSLAGMTMVSVKKSVDGWFRRHGSVIQLAVVAVWLLCGFGGWLLFRAGWLAPWLVVAAPAAVILFVWAEKPPSDDDGGGG